MFFLFHCANRIFDIIRRVCGIPLSMPFGKNCVDQLKKKQCANMAKTQRVIDGSKSMRSARSSANGADFNRMFTQNICLLGDTWLRVTPRRQSFTDERYESAVSRSNKLRVEIIINSVYHFYYCVILEAKRVFSSLSPHKTINIGSSSPNKLEYEQCMSKSIEGDFILKSYAYSKYCLFYSLRSSRNFNNMKTYRRLSRQRVI